jgi:hypothetical protein
VNEYGAPTPAAMLWKLFKITRFEENATPYLALLEVRKDLLQEISAIVVKYQGCKTRSEENRSYEWLLLVLSEWSIVGDYPDDKVQMMVREVVTAFHWVMGTDGSKPEPGHD